MPIPNLGIKESQMSSRDRCEVPSDVATWQLIGRLSNLRRCQRRIQLLAEGIVQSLSVSFSLFQSLSVSFSLFQSLWDLYLVTCIWQLAVSIDFVQG